jgi:hypothetical protein
MTALLCILQGRYVHMYTEGQEEVKRRSVTDWDAGMQLAHSRGIEMSISLSDIRRKVCMKCCTYYGRKVQ